MFCLISTSGRRPAWIFPAPEPIAFLCTPPMGTVPTAGLAFTVPMMLTAMRTHTHGGQTVADGWQALPPNYSFPPCFCPISTHTFQIKIIISPCFQKHSRLTDACQKIFVTSPQWRAIKQLAGSGSNCPSNLQRKVCETVDEFFVDIIKIKGYVIQLFLLQ